jgi:serine O-acetyltransferase
MFFYPFVKKLGGFHGLRTKYQQTKLPFMKNFYLFLNRGFQHETNSYLPFETKIAGPIYFVHGIYGIFISGGAVIGKNCILFQQVTIGSNMLIDSKGFGSPVIGDNCLIGAGAKIIGNVKIGNNCRIGANAVVTTDLPDNSVCVAGKPVIVKKEKLINCTYTNSLKGWGYFEDGRFVLEKDPEILVKLNNQTN